MLISIVGAVANAGCHPESAKGSGSKALFFAHGTPQAIFCRSTGMHSGDRAYQQTRSNSSSQSGPAAPAVLADGIASRAGLTAAIIISASKFGAKPASRRPPELSALVLESTS